MPPPIVHTWKLYCYRLQSATPSGVSQYEPQSIFVSRLPSSSANTEEGNLPRPIRTSHDLAHSIGFPKPPSYNIEWSRVTPIRTPLITGPQTNHRLKTSIQSRVESFTQSNSTLETAWRFTHVARRKLVLDRLAEATCR